MERVQKVACNIHLKIVDDYIGKDFRMWVKGILLKISTLDFIYSV